MIRERFGVEEASNMLDHSSVKMTEVYAERDREQAIEMMEFTGDKKGSSGFGFQEGTAQRGL